MHSQVDQEYYTVVGTSTMYKQTLKKKFNSNNQVPHPEGVLIEKANIDIFQLKNPYIF